jgi:hypothetical protein
MLGMMETATPADPSADVTKARTPRRMMVVGERVDAVAEGCRGH